MTASRLAAEIVEAAAQMVEVLNKRDTMTDEVSGAYFWTDDDHLFHRLHKSARAMLAELRKEIEALR